MDRNAAQNTVRQGLATGRPFALCRLPGREDFLLDGTDGVSLRFNEFNRPFEDLAPVRLPKELPAATSSEDYGLAVGEIIRRHRQLGYGKTVLSRVIAGVTDTRDLTSGLFEYFDRNPAAFCVAASDGNGRIWVMASPEILLRLEGNKFMTMALAGTRKAHSAEPWDVKNSTEQGYVSAFIRHRLVDMGIRYEESDNHTLVSNNVEHLCTVFSGKFEKRSDYSCLIDLISPTPAVSGYPRDFALENIARFERHARGLYAGYSVLETADGNIYAFVNLRGALIDINSGEFALYTGSGITLRSVPEDEWSETAEKARPLLEILLSQHKTQ